MNRRVATRSLLGPLFAAIFSLFAPALAGAVSFEGVVVGIADGDTLTVLDGRLQRRVRLSGIDAPEKGQPFSNRSKERLSDLTFRQKVQVDSTKIDRYGRHVGRVTARGVDVALQQLQDGLAWHYLAYAHEQPTPERLAYAAAERRARLARLGLWSHPQQLPPWEFRRARRKPMSIEP